MTSTARSKELKQIADLALFAKIVQTGGITRCASSLGMERTTVSRRLGSLERELGVKLLERTPKRISVTEAGKRCFEQCELLLQAARSAQNAATVGRSVLDPAPIVVGAPPDIFESYLDDRLTEFEALHPSITIDRFPVSTMSRDVFDMVDVVISWENPRNTSALATRVTGVGQSVYASPAYLAKRREPTSPFDLDRHLCIVEAPAAGKHTWEFRSGTETIRTLVRGRFAVSGLLQVRETTLAGLGLGRLPDYLCHACLETGRVVKVLEEYRAVDRDLYIITPKQESSKPRATSLRMYLEDVFRSHRL